MENLDMLVSGESLEPVKCCNIKQPAAIVVCAMQKEFGRISQL